MQGVSKIVGKRKQRAEHLKLFEPITIRRMTIKNRIVMSPMGTNFSHVRGVSRAFYEERAKGGTGAIIIGGILVDAFAQDKSARNFYEWVARPAQAHGAKIGPQLFYGNFYPSSRTSGVIQQWVAPSAGLPPGTKAVLGMLREVRSYCRELTVAEIKDIISRYAAAASKAKEVGFDFIEIHGCHGHNLPHQFFSPIDNRRTDQYGGTLEGRMRFGTELARAIREAVGSDYPFFWRLCAEEALPGGFTFEECQSLCIELEKAGVDVIDVSYGHESGNEIAPTSYFTPSPGEEVPEAGYVPYAEKIKRRISIPVIGVGRINTLDVAESVVREGKADLVAIGRQLLADPYWPQKVAENKHDAVVPCIYCCHCFEELENGHPIRCSVNARMGREDETAIVPAVKKARVVVVGGGPGGMEAARVAALRGHEVTLYEKGPALGGQLMFAAKPPRKSRIASFASYLITQMDKLGVRVELNQAASAQLITNMKPDAVVLATGVNPAIPPIKGIDRGNIITAEDLLGGADSKVGMRVAVIGGGEVGLEVAELLAERGKQVIVVEMLDELAANLSYRRRNFLLYNLARKGVTTVTGTRCEQITGQGLTITRKGRQQVIPVDTVVLAAGSVANNTLASELEGKANCLYVVGDCVQPRRIVNAIEEGFRAGSEL